MNIEGKFTQVFQKNFMHRYKKVHLKN